MQTKSLETEKSARHLIRFMKASHMGRGDRAFKERIKIDEQQERNITFAQVRPYSILTVK
jgi:hypothetical protein